MEELKRHVCELEERLVVREEDGGGVMSGGVMGGGVMGESGDSSELDEPDGVCVCVRVCVCVCVK